MVARKQLHDIPHLHFLPTFVAGKEFLRFPLGENEARCFAFSKSFGQWPIPYPLAKIMNLFESTILLGEKVAKLLSISRNRVRIRTP